VQTGLQRLLHDVDQPPPPGLPPELTGTNVHICGEDVWAGWPHGTTEAIAYGLTVRPAGADDHPLTGWIPCPPEHPDARPDLDRLVRAGRWNPIRQRWELPEEAVRRG
jgi:hypothetical protein